MKAFPILAPRRGAASPSTVATRAAAALSKRSPRRRKRHPEGPAEWAIPGTIWEPPACKAGALTNRANRPAKQIAPRQHRRQIDRRQLGSWGGSGGASLRRAAAGFASFCFAAAGFSARRAGDRPGNRCCGRRWRPRPPRCRPRTRPRQNRPARNRAAAGRPRATSAKGPPPPWADSPAPPIDSSRRQNPAAPAGLPLRGGRSTRTRQSRRSNCDRPSR